MPLQEAQSIWLNGEFVPWSDATTHMLSHGLQYGSAVFEGMRAYATKDAGVSIFRGRDHLERLHFSARAYRLGLKFSVDELLVACQQTVVSNGLGDCYIRPVVFPGYGDMGPGAACPVAEVAIAAIPANDRSYPTGPKQPIKVGVSSWRRPAPGTIPTGVKASGNYLSSRLISIEASENGYDDGLALTHDGLVSEAQAANIFVVRNGKIQTPALSSGILDGITRDTVISLAREMGLSVTETAIPREALYRADEVFLTGTASEIVPVASVDRIDVRNPSFDITNAITQAYFGIFGKDAMARSAWLDDCL